MKALVLLIWLLFSGLNVWAEEIRFAEINSIGFMASQRIMESGTIFDSQEGKILLSEGDIVYVSLKKAQGIKPGDHFTIYTTSEPLRHPITKKKLGYIHRILGEVEIVEVKGNVSIAQILHSYNPISVGNKLMPFHPASPTISLKTGKKEIEGHIVAAKGQPVEIGWNNIVYIDLGEKDGVEIGNSFGVYRECVGTLPPVKLGEIVVLSTQKETSTALVTKCTRPFHKGQTIRMKVNSKEE